MKYFEKITDEIWDIPDDDSVFKHLNNELVSRLTGHIADKQMEYIQSLIDCESPIEQMLALELIDVVGNKSDIPMLLNVVDVCNQEWIRCRDGVYRVDFLIPVEYWNCRKYYIIECDGHEFHQKTKQQVERDNKRTRNLQLSGYDVIRFSGTEIFKSARNCALEVKRIIQSPAIKLIETVIKNEQD